MSIAQPLLLIPCKAEHYEGAEMVATHNIAIDQVLLLWLCKSAVQLCQWSSYNFLPQQWPCAAQLPSGRFNYAMRLQSTTQHVSLWQSAQSVSHSQVICAVNQPQGLMARPAMQEAAMSPWFCVNACVSQLCKCFSLHKDQPDISEKFRYQRK